METHDNEIVLKPDSLIGDIQLQFNSLYPFLKIEFLKSGELPGLKNSGLNSGYRIMDLSKSSPIAKLNVNKYRTVAQITDDCLNKFGLTMQLFRKSGNVWNVISLTDNWTLESQNNAGEFISSEMSGVSTLPIKVA